MLRSLPTGAPAPDRTDIASPPAPGPVYLVGAGPGDPDLLTVRALRLLEAADLVLYDALVSPAIRDLIGVQAEKICVGKTKGRHSVPQAAICAELVAQARRGRSVIRLKAGDPLIFGRAGEELAALRAAGIAVEIVPGITAALAAAADAQIPLTLRGTSQALVLATGHGAEGAEPEGWEALAAAGATIALYMGRTAAARLSARLLAGGLAAATPVAAIEHAGRPERRLFAGCLADLPRIEARDDLSGPVLILIGPAVAAGALAFADPFAAALSLAA